MSTFTQLRDGLSHAWETITDGWREFVDRAGDALTRFHPRVSTGELQTRDESIAQRGARWSVLPAEVKANENEVCVDVEVPGMEPDDFSLQVIDDILVIRGEKKIDRERNDGRYHVMERAYGAFERAVRLPTAVDEAHAKARYKKGVLHVSLPISATHKARRIKVQSI